MLRIIGPLCIMIVPSMTPARAGPSQVRIKLLRRKATIATRPQARRGGGKMRESN